MHSPDGAVSLSSESSLKSFGKKAWGVRAFGVQIRSELRLVGATLEATEASRHEVRITQMGGGAARPAQGKPLLERLHGDGSLGMRVVRLEDGRHWIEAPGHGSFEVSPDGSMISYDRLARPRWRWHRPLCGQALPLAATLRGFELLHASAVVFGEGAVAFVAQSGAGKSSLALALFARGAPLFTDDILAVEVADGDVVAHPGAAMANIAREQLELLPEAVRGRLGMVIGTSDKVHVEVSDIATEPLPLAAVFLLRRSRSVERLTLAQEDAPAPRDLLAATFMPHIVTPARLVTQLTTCAEIAASVPLFRLEAPASLTAAQLASAVESHVAEAVG